MTIRLIRQGEAFVCTEGLAQMWGEQGREERLRRNPHGQPLRPRVRRLSVLEQLGEDGRLRKVQVDAGKEINRYWHLWTGALFSRTTGEGSGFGTGVVDTPALRNLVGRYRAWAEPESAHRLRGEVTALDVVLAVAVDDLAIKALRRRFCTRQETVLGWLRDSLHLYGTLAGWRDIEARDAA
jgi:hypothetical protein